mgnify:CR=1 FL=1
MGLRCRLVSVFKPSDDSAKLPGSVLTERKQGVPKCLWGWSVLQGPKILRFLFFVDSRYNVAEDDLVASHLKEMATMCDELGIPAASLAYYVSSVDIVRAKRIEWAAEMGVPVSAVKKLLAMLGYGNSGADWMAEYKVIYIYISI